MPSIVMLPNAATRPRGSTTIGMSTDERDDVRDGVLLIALSTLVAGFVGGYIVGRRRTRARNPEWMIDEEFEP